MYIFQADQLAGLASDYRRDLINTLAGLKSPTLVGTVDQGGTTNLALFNSLIHIGANPPLLGVIFRPLTVTRHTYQNIRDTGFFTINHIHQDMMPQAHQTSAKYATGTSEFDACGFTPVFTQLHPAPYVGEALVAASLSYVEEHLIQANGTILLVGNVVEVRVQEGLLEPNGSLAFDKAPFLASSGLNTYLKAEKFKRFAYAKPDTPVQEIP
jgi:flavin reductase (DIM6/NTAB) family NADH-FMN oxidoreductase RutF